MAFIAGFAAGPAARGIGRGLGSVNGLRLALATFGLSPRDIVAGIRAARRFMAAASSPTPPGGAG
jgi:hypothetical protein